MGGIVVKGNKECIKQIPEERVGKLCITGVTKETRIWLACLGIEPFENVEWDSLKIRNFVIGCYNQRLNNRKAWNELCKICVVHGTFKDNTFYSANESNCNNEKIFRLSDKVVDSLTIVYWSYIISRRYDKILPTYQIVLNRRNCIYKILNECC
jgi:hypothetical protein